MDAVLLLLVVAYLMAIIYAANQVEIGEWTFNTLQPMLYGLVGVVALLAFVTFVGLGLPLPQLNGDAPIDRLDPLALVLSLLLVVACVAGAALVTRSEAARYRVPSFISEPSIYRPNSPVHLAAVVLSLMLVCSQALTFLSGGGLAGVAQDVAISGLSVFELLLNMVLWVSAAFLGVGYLLRRDLSQALTRLGLRAPTRGDVLGGVAVGLGLFGMSIAFSILWQAFAPPEQFAEQNQAAQQIAMSIDRFALVLAVSLSAAIGEEIFIRGALQPVFGVALSSAFFAVLHSQYLFAPSMLFIFAVSVGLGLLRRHTSTTAAIIAHFVYNFVPLFFSYLALSSMGGAP